MSTKENPMHNLLDDYAQNNDLREIDPKLKLLLGLGCILLCVSSATLIVPLFIAITLSIITVTLAKIPASFYARLLLIPLSFSILSALVVAFMHGTGDQLFAFEIFGFNLVIRVDGASLALLLIARTFGGMCALFFIALTTPMIEVFSVLKSMRIPESVIDLSMMIYRYIFVFLNQAVAINNAQKMRLGDKGIKNSLNSFAMLASVLFIRSWEQGERLMVAMDARCYDGKLDLLEHNNKMEPRAILAVLGYLTIIMALAVLTRDFQFMRVGVV
jgi:cobalt/nickel transport system permease protein